MALLRAILENCRIQLEDAHVRLPATSEPHFLAIGLCDRAPCSSVSDPESV